jgi:hypothetical protein
LKPAPTKTDKEGQKEKELLKDPVARGAAGALRPGSV